MRIYANQLAAHLNKSLLPVYLVTGDDPLLAIEAADSVRAKARQQGYSERQVIEGNTESDWTALVDAGRAMSLFAQRQVLDVRLAKSKTDSSAQWALEEYLKDPSPDHLLLISAPKLDKGVSRQKWFTRLEQCGAVVTVSPLKRQDVPAWIRRRAGAAGLQLDDDAVALIAERNEGNLLALAQEIQKLVLLLGAGPVTVRQVAQAVAESARYNIFDLVDTCLQGDRRRVVRMFDGLHAEAVAPAQVLWWLSRDIRALALMAQTLAKGKPLERVLADQFIWEVRKPLFRKALTKLPSRRWQELLCRCAELDRRVKGFGTGNVWDVLLELGLQMS